MVERKFLRFPEQPVTAPLYEIVIARNGTFKRAQRREMTASIKLSNFRQEIPELADGSAFVEMKKRIPAGVFQSILNHARESTEPFRFTENIYAVNWNQLQGDYVWEEISRDRRFGSTIARDEKPAYQTAILEIHTHPPNCRNFSSQDNSDESGKFRLFGILVDIHGPKPLIRLRVGIYDSFWEIPLETVSDGSPENLSDLVREEEDSLFLGEYLISLYQPEIETL